MGFLDDIKTKMDQNGDGKLSVEDLEGFKDILNQEQIDSLKDKADQNGDGKLSFDDITSLDFGNMLDSAKNSIGDFFKK